MAASEQIFWKYDIQSHPSSHKRPNYRSHIPIHRVDYRTSDWQESDPGGEQGGNWLFILIFQTETLV
jgi:hypothetical protein